MYPIGLFFHDLAFTPRGSHTSRVNETNSFAYNTCTIFISVSHNICKIVRESLLARKICDARNAKCATVQKSLFQETFVYLQSLCRARKEKAFISNVNI